MAAKDEGEGEWPHHQILRVHRLYAFRQHLHIQKAVPYLLNRKAIPKSLAKDISECPLQKNDDYNINFLLGYLREAKVERFVRFIEGLGDSISAASAEISKSHAVLINTMSEDLEKISNADMEQVRRVRAVVKMTRADESKKLEAEKSVGISDTVQASTDNTSDVVSESERESNTVIETVEPTNEAQSSDRKEMASAIESQTTTKREREREVEPAMSSLQRIIKPGISNLFQRDTLTKDQKSWSLYNSTHGISIDIPVKAVPSEILKFVVIAHAYLNGNYKIPEEYEVCTAIVTLRTKPDFDFLEPVSLTLPHSAVFDGDEDDEDLVVLRAPDPAPNTDEYDFRNDIIHSAVSFDDYHVHVSLDHFSAVAGAKRRKKHRCARRGPPWRRQDSCSKQRSIKGTMRKKMRNLRKKGSSGSVGSSRGSSYDTSFESDAPHNPRRGSSADSEAPVQRSLLHRQGAIDDNTPGTSAHMVHQTSSEDDDASCNEICVAFYYPTQRLTSWTNRFLVAPNHPTGIAALTYYTETLFEGRCQGKPELHPATPCSRTLCFAPEEWKNDQWIVKAKSTPRISLDIVQCAMQSQLQVVDFEAESTNQQSSTPLKHDIRVTGFDEELFFTIKSTKKSEVKPYCQIYIKSWLYNEDSQVLKRLKLPRKSEDKDFALNPSIEDHHLKADICKLVTEVAFQIADKHKFVEQIPISDQHKQRLFLEPEYYDPTECIYRALFVWIHEKRPSFFELEWLLQSVGFENIVLSDSDAPTQDSSRPCERQLCTHLARKLQHKHWKFVGRYLGLDRADIDGVEYDFHYRGGLTEVIFKMLEIWCQQFGKEAKIISLLKAVSRVNMLDLCCFQDAVSYLEKELNSTESF